jgi:quaternary ammonium compound-resistance protein SugE
LPGACPLLDRSIIGDIYAEAFREFLQFVLDQTHLTSGGQMAWLMLVAAGLCEIVWAIGLKYTQGFTKPLATVVTITAMIVSIVLLGAAMKSLPVGTSYAVWVGIGAVGTAILGIILFGESTNPGRLASLTLLIAGIIGLKLTTPG